MSKISTDLIKTIAWPAYYVALVLVAVPAADFATNILPARLGDVQWRYGSAGLLTAYMPNMLFGMLLAVGASAVLEHLLILRILSLVNVIVALLFVITVGFLGLDVLQLRSTVPLEARPTFDLGAEKAILKYVALAAGHAWLGVSVFRSTRSISRERRKRSDSSEVPLVRR